MAENLYQLAKEYVGFIEKIERTSDPDRIQSLEEKRGDLHWKFMDLLKKQGIKFKDRDHAVRNCRKNCERRVMTLIEIARIYTDLVQVDGQIPAGECLAKDEVGALRTKYHQMFMDKPRRRC